MYSCPICNRIFETKDEVAKHSLKCWKEQHPYHKSKPAPRSADIVEREINDDVLNFFASLQKGGQPCKK